MALNGGRILCNTSTITPYTRLPLHRPFSFTHPSSRTPFHLVSAAKKLSSRTGKFDSRNKRGSTSTTEDESSGEFNDGAIGTVDGTEVENFDGYVLPDLPGLEPDFWEGPQWDAFGFFVEYLWAFGIVFALVSSGIAVSTYNEGATDFKETPAYKESIQSRDLLEEPEASSPDVFESNPTEEAPTLE
ncbi:uncharacterized protein LOC112525844 [Cynara cardunculus var. scolymus]|uniref:Uncharacterized protein n=1 Tax=Cynara cardunculus var. scolymus TaxID=59895 RepID=A0A118K2F7_CYNCS|nr:uncharacterized protein LOC112525844 [Cynara cardunculus var. scolymus]KVI04273.1 hypothetical protein Ccrd_017416 [Cynara cardunculus var. scolymus]